METKSINMIKVIHFQVLMNGNSENIKFVLHVMHRACILYVLVYVYVYVCMLYALTHWPLGNVALISNQ